ncbi:transmembrane protein [Cyclospora cayetanensis]|uniref:Transmembrane protein n=1 Tax=Cyclospora cayetanensis TaxID=88456 RepID=A0A1D3D4G1_9EIME|nr:transmembrane protein [Cyclospora cayetanensis]
MSVCDSILNRLKSLEVPTPPSANDKTLYLILGVLNCFLFGVGMIIIGVMTADNANLLIGVLQLVLPFVGTEDARTPLSLFEVALECLLSVRVGANISQERSRESLLSLVE